MMNLAELKEQVFAYGHINNDCPDGESGIIAQVEAEGQMIIANEIEAGRINEIRSDELMKLLMSEYGR